MWRLPDDQDELLEKAKAQNGLVEEAFEDKYVYSCQTIGCTHNPCLENPAHPPKQYLVAHDITREYKLEMDGGVMKFWTGFTRHYKKFDDVSEYNDTPEYIYSTEYESRLS